MIKKTILPFLAALLIASPFVYKAANETNALAADVQQNTKKLSFSQSVI